MKKLLVFIFLALINPILKAQISNPKHPVFCSINYIDQPGKLLKININWRKASDSSIIAYKIKTRPAGGFSDLVYIGSRDSTNTSIQITKPLEGFEPGFSLFSVDSNLNEYSDSTIFQYIHCTFNVVQHTTDMFFNAINNQTQDYIFYNSLDSGRTWGIIKTFTLKSPQKGDYLYNSLPSGLYQIMTINNNCYSNEQNESYVNWWLNPTGIIEREKDANIQFYPNPNNGRIEFVIPAKLGSKLIPVQIINNLGEVEEDFFISSNEPSYTLTRKRYNSGVYYLKYDKDPIIQKLILKK